MKCLTPHTDVAFGADFLLPFVQFLTRSEGTLAEREKWLHDLGEEPDCPRDYVRKLEERLRQGERERLAEEKIANWHVKRSGTRRCNIDRKAGSEKGGRMLYDRDRQGSGESD